MTQFDGNVSVTPWRDMVRRVPPIVMLAILSLVAMSAYTEMLSQAGQSDTAVATVVVVGVAGVLSGIAGFAFSAICGAMLFQFRHDTIGVVEIMLVCSLANQIMNVWLLRRDLRLGPIVPFLTGGLVGVPIGVLFLLHLDARLFKMLLGLLLVVYGCFMLARRPVILTRVYRGGDWLVGFVGGVVGGFAAIPGAAVSIWCSMKDRDKVRQRAVVQPYILSMQIIALIAIPALRGHGGPSIAIPPVSWLCLPAGLLGTWWGVTLFRRLTDRQFVTTVNVLLIVSGIGLVV